MKNFLLFLFLSLLIQSVSAQDYTRVKEYYMSIVVHEDNSYDVHEELKAHFAEERHGIYRYIPYTYWIDDKQNQCDIYNLEVGGDKYELSDENNNLLIKIGDAENTLTGDKDYTLDYRLQNRDDRIDAYDKLKYSILGPDFELYIDELSFTIEFDKPLPAGSESLLKVMSGDVGSKTNALGAEVWIEDGVIYGHVTDVGGIQPLTVELPLPEGYFVGEKSKSPLMAYIMLGLVAVLVVVILYYELIARQPDFVKHIEFYPPKGMCSAEVGLIIDDRIDKEDLASLIPWFASEGLIRIDEKEEKGIFGKNKYLEITRLKAIPYEYKPYQRTFFHALFINNQTTVRLDRLTKVDSEVRTAKQQLEDEFDGERKLTRWHKSVWLLLPLLLVSTAFFIFALPYDFFKNDDAYLVFGFWTYSAVMGFMKIYKASGAQRTDGKWSRWGWRLLRLLAMSIAMALHLWLLGDLIVDTYYLIAVYAACFIIVELSERLKVDTPYRAELLGHLTGFKEFLETAEEQRLRSLVEEDKFYFYRILPYALALNVSNAWAEHFEKIEMECPTWYHASSAYGTTGFARSLTSSLSSATSSAISTMSPSSSGGGAGSGSGGGGGGAW